MKPLKNNKCFIVAEIGINHNGDLDTAFKLIDMASECGCDAVKFQKRNINIVYDQETLDSSRESPWGTTTRDQKSKLEFDKNDYDKIDEYCKNKNIKWYASCWDLDSLNFLKSYNLKYNKIASAMLTYKPLLEEVAKEQKYTFISVGLSSISDVSEAVNVFEKNDCPYELMYTRSTYPSEIKDIDLNCIPMLQNRFNCKVGYSGHERSAYFISLAAVAIGATSVERHITLDRTMYGSDQPASIEKSGLMQLVKGIKTIELTFGSGQLYEIEDEKKIKEKLRWFDTNKQNS